MSAQRKRKEAAGPSPLAETFADNLVTAVEHAGGNRRRIASALDGVHETSTLQEVTPLLRKVKAPSDDKKKRVLDVSMADQAAAILARARGQRETWLASGQEGEAQELLATLPPAQTAAEIVGDRSLEEAQGDLRGYLQQVDAADKGAQIVKWRAAYLKGYLLQSAKDSVPHGETAAFYAALGMTRQSAAACIKLYLVLKEFPGIALTNVVGLSLRNLSRPIGTEMLRQLRDKKNADWVDRLFRVAPQVTVRVGGEIGEVAVAQRLTAAERLLEQCFREPQLETSLEVLGIDINKLDWHDMLADPDLGDPLFLMARTAAEIVAEVDEQANFQEHAKFEELSEALVSICRPRDLYQEDVPEFAAQFLRDFSPRLPFPLGDLVADVQGAKEADLARELATLKLKTATSMAAQARPVDAEALEVNSWLGAYRMFFTRAGIPEEKLPTAIPQPRFSLADAFMNAGALPDIFPRVAPKWTGELEPGYMRHLEHLANKAMREKAWTVQRAEFPVEAAAEVYAPTPRARARLEAARAEAVKGWWDRQPIWQTTPSKLLKEEHNNIEGGLEHIYEFTMWDWGTEDTEGWTTWQLTITDIEGEPLKCASVIKNRNYVDWWLPSIGRYGHDIFINTCPTCADDDPREQLTMKYFAHELLGREYYGSPPKTQIMKTAAKEAARKARANAEAAKLDLEREDEMLME